MIFEINVTKNEDQMMYQDRLIAYRSAVRDSQTTAEKES